jgi:PPP family 3-phenylpropionic acid transporter
LDETAPVNGLRPIKVVYFIYFSTFGLYVAYINVYYRSIGLTGTQIGWISAAIPLVAMLSGPVWGLLSDLVGKARRLLAIAGFGSLLTMLALSAARDFAWLLPLAALQSLFYGNMTPMLDSVNLGMLGKARERYGEQRIWGSIGYIFSTLGFGLLLRQTGLHWLFYAYAIVMVLFLLGLKLLPDQHVTVGGSPWKDLGKLITRPQWMFLSAAIALLWLATSGMNNFLGVYIDGLGGSASLIGAASSVGALSEIPVMLYSGRLVSRFGLERMLAFSFVVYAVRFVLYAFMPAPIWALPINMLNGLSFGLFWVCSVMYVSHMAPGSLRATSQTLLAAVLSLASMVGAPFGGYIFDHSGPTSLFLIYAVFALVGLGVLLAGFRYNRRRPV